MEYISFGNFSHVGEFVYSYVGKAFELAKKEFPLTDFYNNLFDSVSQSSGLSRDSILHLHHSFHWAFFNRDNGSSPFEFVDPIKPNEIRYIKLKKKDYNLVDVLDMSNKILDNYGNYLIERRKKP